MSCGKGESMPRRHASWRDIDDVLDDCESSFILRFVECMMQLRAGDFIFLMGLLLASVVCFCTPTPPQVASCFKAGLAGAPGPPSARSDARVRAARCCLGQGCHGMPHLAACHLASMDHDPAELAAAAVESISHIYANSA